MSLRHVKCRPKHNYDQLVEALCYSPPLSLGCLCTLCKARLICFCRQATSVLQIGSPSAHGGKEEQKGLQQHNAHSV